MCMSNRRAALLHRDGRSPRDCAFAACPVRNRLWLIVGLLFFGTIGMACGHEKGNASLAEYFRNLDITDPAILTPAAEQQAQLSSQVDAATSDQDVVTALQTFVTSSEPLMKQILSDAKAIQPPSQVRLQHERLLAAYEGYLGALQTIAAQLSNIHSRAEALDIVSRILLPAQDAVSTACKDLLQVARQNGIASNNSCGGPTAPALT